MRYGFNNELFRLERQRRDIRASRKLLSAFIALTHTGVSKDLVVQLNDSGLSFDEIADYLDSSNELANLK
jgi:hypothetical protein